ncbi:MAG: glycosyltransferase, partial [Gammaproteobacteria bacterium]
MQDPGINLAAQPRPLVSVILPVRAPSRALLQRCLASFAALGCISRMELIVVRTGPLDPAWLEPACAFGRLEIIECEVPGIYPAFNAGIAHARGNFLLFFGHDDIALPDMDVAVQLLGSMNAANTLVACGVYVQGLGVRWPSLLRQAIVFRNWGHQGLLYPATRIERDAYDPAYPLRADHRLNMKLLSDESVSCVRLRLVVACFSR